MCILLFPLECKYHYQQYPHPVFLVWTTEIPPPPPKKKKKKTSTINRSPPSPFSNIYTSTPCPYYLHVSFCSNTFPFLSHYFFFESVTYPPTFPDFCLLFGLSIPPTIFSFDLGSTSPGLSFGTFDPDHCHTLVWTAFEPIKPPPRLKLRLASGTGLPLPLSIFCSH